ncbi:hypothetical protein [Deinococcus peraridilitoris]|uniref:Lipoprotein n=1 Tax=Deinococcus peraridilitoris (strain DSM 19664 / LMG 22246 / CIP 109416 / KR-200) TaxID=937777 RepID=L0A1U8_DEIPD|nr:hypothetical protein [Deinococcus peraridilitoris]AFZ67429.1 hypothetical protein Deipe_1925 [Deinococcus peraridilitoris DSM 19664]
MKRFSALLISGALTLAACGQMADTQLPSNNPPGQGGTAPGQNPGNNNTGSVSLDLNAEAMADIKVTARNATTGQMYQDVSKLPAGTYVLVFTNIKTNVTVEVRVDVQINKTVTVQVPEKVKGGQNDGGQTNTGSVKIDASVDVMADIKVTAKNVTTGQTYQDVSKLPAGTYVLVFTNIKTNVTVEVRVDVQINKTVTVQVPEKVKGGQNDGGQTNTGSVKIDASVDVMADIKVTAKNVTTGQTYQDVSKLPAGTYVLVFTNIKTNVTVEVRVDVQINKTVTVQVPEKVKGDGQQTNTGSLKIDLSAELQKFINVTVKNVNTGTEIAKENYNNLPIGTYVVIFKNIQTNITAQVNVEVKANTTVNVQVPSNVMPVSLQ